MLNMKVTEKTDNGSESKESEVGTSKQKNQNEEKLTGQTQEEC